MKITFYSDFILSSSKSFNVEIKLFKLADQIKKKIIFYKKKKNL